MIRDVTNRYRTRTARDAGLLRGRGARRGIAATHLVRAASALAGRGHQGQPAGAERDGVGDRGSRRPPVLPDRAVQGPRRAWRGVLHELHLEQEPRPDLHPVRLGHLPLVRHAAPGARAGHRGEGQPVRDRGLLGEPAARFAAGRVGLAAEQGGQRALYFGQCAGQHQPAVREHRRDPGAPALGRLADPPADRRVLAGQARPDARPAGVRAHRRRLASTPSRP